MSTRDACRAFEANLSSGQRKRLGQFFTGMPLGKLLTHLALDMDTKTVLDPMAGHGDLLDATLETAWERGISLNTLEGIEIDEATAAMCRERLSQIYDRTQHDTRILTANAFDTASITRLSRKSYDLVITNPPYVRYQQQKSAHKKRNPARDQLCEIANFLLTGSERTVYHTLIDSYSGLADLSIPSWMLASILVKQGGHIALVIPATWRSRDYADVIRYLLLRCFSLEFVVEDTQPGWFSNALVRTNLIVARKLPEQEIAKGVSTRIQRKDPLWVQLSPEAGAHDSLVGAAFPGERSESEFTQWIREGASHPKSGISLRRFSLSDEWNGLRQKIARTTWYRELEGKHSGGIAQRSATTASVPSAFKDFFSGFQLSENLASFDGIGIRVGQGLRTGCNRFFYVTACESSKDNVLVQASDFFGGKKFRVPAAALKPVLRRQMEIETLKKNDVPCGRVLDLRRWVLPEDWKHVLRSKSAYENAGGNLPNRMPEDLAEFVRAASSTFVVKRAAGKRVPHLSAVRTNVRLSKDGKTMPRFWYMLPDFAPRHVPAAFVARINHSVPWVEANLSPPILIDANFSSFWSEKEEWTPSALKALLNSSWCRMYMEIIGTQLGGGALKLEATHLREMVVPDFPLEKISQLTQFGERLASQHAPAIQDIDALVFACLLKDMDSSKALITLGRSLTDRAYELSLARRNVA